MSKSPPVPAGNQSPYPVQEPPHDISAASSSADDATARFDGARDAIGEQLTTAREALGEQLNTAKEAAAPLVENARAFAKARPWATAALVGTIALAVVNTLRGKKA